MEQNKDLIWSEINKLYLFVEKKMLTYITACLHWVEISFISWPRWTLMHFSLVSLVISKLSECHLEENRKAMPLNSCAVQTQQQQEEGPFSQVSGSTGNKQAEYWKTVSYQTESEVRSIDCERRRTVSKCCLNQFWYLSGIKFKNLC